MNIEKATSYTMIRIHDIEADDIDLICAFFTTNPKMFLDMYLFAVQNDIEMNCNEYFGEKTAEKYKDCIFYIKEITMNFGGKESYPTIEVFVEAAAC